MSEYVYFIRPTGMPGPIKIGWSNVPRQRLELMMTWSPFPLELIAAVPGNRQLERNIHECFADVHSHREWFHPSQALLDAVAKIADGVPVDEAIDLEARVGRIGRFAQHLPRRTPEMRLRSSYRTRFYWATRKAEEADERDCWYSVPGDVSDILDRWSYQERQRPTDAEFARLDEVLADPMKHCPMTLRDREAA